MTDTSENVSVEAQTIAADEEFARQLQQSFYEEAQAQNVEIIIEDDDDEDDVIFVSNNENPIPVVGIDVDFESDVEYQGEISPAGWIIEELGETFNPSVNMSWKEINEFAPNIIKIWDICWELYFSTLRTAKPVIAWSTDLANKAFRVAQTEVLLNSNLKFYPRMDFLSAMLRAMTVYHLRYDHQMEDSSSNFKFNMTRIRKHINQLWLANVRVDDEMEGTPEVYKRQWYRCTGICQNYPPFNGNYRSESTPGGQNQWWVQHTRDCGGSLFRTYVASRKIGNRVDMKFIAHVNHMKVKVNMQNSAFIVPQEYLDLTSDDCVPLREYSSIINVDDELELVTNQEPARSFYHKFDESLGSTYDTFNVPCIFCKEKIPRKLFGNHLDGCKGVSQQVTVSYRAISRMGC